MELLSVNMVGAPCRFSSLRARVSWSSCVCR